jgi:acetyltransferase-like isoleucine patch superfamily enzyme
VHVHEEGFLKMGENFRINNTKTSNPIGREGKCSFYICKGGKLLIGNNVSMSSTSIVCQKEIVIEDYVKIGGNTCIYDTDFHSLNHHNRKIAHEDRKNTIYCSVKIEQNCFIGAHCTILKGVTIGKNSIIGACSVVTKDIPENQIWGGNPAKFIKNIDI